MQSLSIMRFTCLKVLFHVVLLRVMTLMSVLAKDAHKYEFTSNFSVCLPICQQMIWYLLICWLHQRCEDPSSPFVAGLYYRIVYRLDFPSLRLKGPAQATIYCPCIFCLSTTLSLLSTIQPLLPKSWGIISCFSKIVIHDFITEINSVQCDFTERLSSLIISTWYVSGPWSLLKCRRICYQVIMSSSCSFKSLCFSFHVFLVSKDLGFII